MKQFVAACLMTSALVAAPAIAQAQALGMGAGAQGSQNYAVNGALVTILSEELGLNLRLQSFGGSGASMPLIDSGRLDMQAIVSPDTFAGVQGVEPFGEPMENLRIVGSLGPSTYGFFVRADSPYTRVDEIAGLRITYGYTSQPSLTFQVDSILANSGLSIDDMEPVLAPSVPRGADDFIAGQADVAFFAQAGGKVQEADASVGIRWLQLATGAEAEAALQEHTPGSYVLVVDPQEGDIGMSEPTAMMAYDYLLVVGAHVDEDLVYNITKALVDHEDRIQNAHRTLSSYRADNLAPPLPGLTYHPGAERYLREAGLWQRD